MIAATIGIVFVAIAIALGVAMRRSRSRQPIENRWLWEGIELAFSSEPELVEPPRLVVVGRYMARPSIYRTAVKDWAFTTRRTPILVMFDVTRGVELHRASLDRISAERHARVDGLSISYAMPPPSADVPDDDTRRQGGPISVDIGFYFEPRAEPWELRVHAELGPLRSESITRTITSPRGSS